MDTERKKYRLGETGFWPSWFAKLLFTLISVKVWGLIASMAISTWLLLMNHKHEPIMIGKNMVEFGINGAQWLTFNTTVWALIFGMKEIFRIAENRDLTDQQTLEQQTGIELKIASLKSDNPSNPQNPSITPEGFEIVPEEP